MSLQQIQNLISDFERLPKEVSESTFLEICRYPKNRFEEVCSRILSFYFQPENEHGLGDLFIGSMLDLLGYNSLYRSGERINVEKEVYTDGKRIDLLISSNNFIIAIENKITAPLNNPLSVYKREIAGFDVEKTFSVVLSAKRLTKAKEIKHIQEYGFINITYADLFKRIAQNLSDYELDLSSKYMTYLFDFIKTFENMNNTTKLDPGLKSFFYNKVSEIDELKRLYKIHVNEISTIHDNRLNELKELISDGSGETHWWVWGQMYLGYNKYETGDHHKIGIESNFDVVGEDPIHGFSINIVCWSVSAWDRYKEKLKKEFSSINLVKDGGKRLFKVESLDGHDNKLIVDKLKHYYGRVLKMISAT